MLDWQKVGAFFYRTKDVYLYPKHLGRSETVDPAQLARDDVIVAVSPLGGPVAVIHTGSRNRAIVFTPSFRLITETELRLTAPIIGAWWSLDLEPVLVVVTADCHVTALTLRPSVYTRRIVLPTKAGTEQLIAVAVGRHGSGLSTSWTVLTESMQLFHVPSTSWASSGDDIAAKAMAVIPRPLALSPVVAFVQLEAAVVASLENGALLLIDATSVTQLLEANDEPSLVVHMMAVSFSGSFLASVTAAGAVTVYSVADIRANVLKPIESSLLDIGVTPSSIAWVGDDCLCVTFSGTRNVLFVGGVGGSWSPYEHASRIHVTSDLLSASVLTASRFQVVQRVAASTYNLSTTSEPEARLLASYERFSANDVHAESILRAIKPSLEKAVIALTEAAAFETPLCETNAQNSQIQRLMKASIFGRQFLPSTVVAANLFVNSAGLIRLCASVNAAEVGIPISVPQLLAMGQQGGALLVQSLAARGLFLLALRVAKWLGVPGTVAVDRWACALIEASDHLPDRELCELITQRVPPRHSLVSIAEFAFRHSARRALATMLLHSENNTEEQVKLLLSLDAEPLAIHKSLAVANCDLVHSCLDAIIKSRKALHELITSKSSDLTNAEVALMMSLVQNRYYEEKKFEDLCKLLQTIPGSELLLADAAIELASGKLPTSLTKADETAEWIQYAAERFAECASAPSVVSVNAGQLVTNSPAGCQSTAALLGDASQLVREQAQLEKTALSKGWPRGPHKFIGLSLDDTLARLVTLNELPEAEQLRTKRRVSDGRWWDVRVRALLLNGKVDDGVAFASKVAPPSSDCRGYKGVVEILLSLKREDLAPPFIRKLKSKKQVELFNQLGLFDDARTAEQQRPSVMSAGFLGKLASGIIGNR